MKKILNALFLTLLAVFTFSSCSDVPAPYDIKGEGDGPELTGDGSKELPYTVADLKVKADGKTVAWVEAYIVAGIKSSAEKSIKSADDVVFGTQPTDVKATSFLIADSGEESDYKNCSAVNLSGKSTGCSAVKAALNLVDNNTVSLPRVVKLKGTLVTNTWGLPGLKEVTAAILADGTVIGEDGEGNPDPVPGDNILKTGGFEEWVDDATPTGWKSASSASKGTLTKSTDKRSGNYAVLVEGSTEANLRLASTEMILKAGTYTLSAYVKAATAEGASARLGYVLIGENNTIVDSQNDYIYGDYINDLKTDSWTTGSYTFILAQEQKVCLLVMNAKKPGKGLLIDDVTLTTADGGIVDGGDPTPTPGEDNPLGLDATNPVADFENTFDDAVYQTDYSKVGWINKALKESRVWQGSKYNDQLYLAASTYGVSEGQTAEYWFVTPAFTVNNDKEFTFDCSVNKYAATMSLKVFFLQLENGKMTQKDLNITVPTSGTYEWTTGIKVDLSDFNNKVGFVGFQYVATKEGTTVSTYAIDNVKYTTGEGGDVDPTPDPENEPYKSDIDMPTADGGSDGYYKATINGFPSLKLGKSKKPTNGTWTSAPIGADKTKLSFYAVGWKEEQTILTVEIVDGGSFVGGETSKTVNLTPNEGLTGGSGNFTIETTDNDHLAFDLTNITANTKIKFSTDKRGAVFGVKIK